MSEIPSDITETGVHPHRRDAVWMAELVDASVSELLRSYASAGGLNNRDAVNLPSKRAVGQICEDLLQIIFPGFHDEDAVHHNSIEEVTAGRLSKVVKQLADQVRKAVRIGDPHKPTGRTPPIIRKFCQSLPEVRELLRTDIEAAFDGDPATLHREEVILSYPFIEAITIQRLSACEQGRQDISPCLSVSAVKASCLGALVVKSFPFFLSAFAPKLSPWLKPHHCPSNA